jgi:hypothetical protein
MSRTYETPEVLEVGAVKDVVFGNTPSSDNVDGSAPFQITTSPLSVLDVD